MAVHEVVTDLGRISSECQHKSCRKRSEDVVDIELAVTNSNELVDHAKPDLLDTVEGGVKYKTMAWWHVGILMIAETVSLGILSLPSAVSRLGLIPGLLLIPALGALATYSGYVIGQFKLKHPHVLSFGDAGEILFGRFGRELFGWAAILSFIFVQAAHILTFSVMMNVLTGHSACSILWGALGAAVSVVLSMPRTLKNVSYISFVAFISIIAAVMLVMLNVSLHHEGGQSIDYFVTNSSFGPIMVGYLDIMLAYAGNAAFFGFVSELKHPETYPKALFLLQGTAVTFYTIVAAIIYYFAGRHVDSPALGAASPLVRKIAYGIALPTIVVAGVINGHVAAKMVYVKFWAWRGKAATITSRSRRAYVSWAVVVTGCWVVAWVLAEAIPIFNELLGLMSALFMSWFSLGFSGMLWLHLNRGGQWRRGVRKMLLTALNVTMIAIAAFSCIGGLLASGMEIAKASSASAAGRPFSCANNDPKAHGH